jgi:hypothetical protein
MGWRLIAFGTTGLPIIRLQMDLLLVRHVLKISELTKMILNIVRIADKPQTTELNYYFYLGDFKQ